MKFFWGFLTAVIIGIIVIGIFGVSLLRAPATSEPSDLETALVNRAKVWFIPDSAETVAPPEKTEQSILEGGEHYGHHCAVCHDLDGDANSEFGEGFYPDVANLTSRHVQAYSDKQLKWIIDNGIRYTGMPGWAKILEDDEEWKIVYYMRALANPEQKEKYEKLLKQMGKWKIEAPTAEEAEAEHEQEQEHEHAEPSGEEHGHAGETPEQSQAEPTTGATGEGGARQSEQGTERHEETSPAPSTGTES